jgi:tRNA (cytidine/uridine-2'-O-)-methyltransferase
MTPHVALVEPRIPPNTGNVARLCAATSAPLHLIEPLGFSLADPAVRRAGLDYWDQVELWVHPAWEAFRRAVGPERCLYFSAHAERSYLEAPYRPNSVLVFGSETDGLRAVLRDSDGHRTYRIPMTGRVRSLNLATAVGIVLYEGIRQLRAAGITSPGDPTLQQAG